jgi:hypothetical protein
MVTSRRRGCSSRKKQVVSRLYASDRAGIRPGTPDTFLASQPPLIQLFAEIAYAFAATNALIVYVIVYFVNNRLFVRFPQETL